MARRLWRASLAGVMVLALLWSGWSAWQLSRLPVTAWLVERSTEQLEAAYDRALARAATPEALSDAIAARLAQSSRNWVAIDGLADLAAAQDMALHPTVAADLDAARAQDFGALHRSRTCLACAFDLRNCTMGADLACGLGVNLTVMGDFMSLAREAGAWSRGESVDQLDVTLSFIGIGATGLVIATGGSSYVVKAGAGVLKTAHRMGRVTPGVQRLYLRAAREGVDWARVPAIRRADDLASAARMDALRPALNVTQDLGVLHARVGMRGSLHMLSAIDSAQDARRMARASRVLGPRSIGAFELLGKARFLRVGLRLSAQIWEMLSGVMAALAAAMAMLWGRVLRFVAKRLRKI